MIDTKSVLSRTALSQARLPRDANARTARPSGVASEFDEILNRAKTEAATSLPQTPPAHLMYDYLLAQLSVASSGNRIFVPATGYERLTSVSAEGKVPAYSAHVVPEDDPSVPSVRMELGRLSAAFESGAQGVAAIGYDPNGGTSYGTYQIASRPGTMERFLDFLAEKAPEWSDRLRSAGPANTGGRSGAMPDAWRKIAAESPRKFEALQHAFIRATHFEPARREILERTGVDIGKRSAVLQEVLWSTAVHHGPTGARRIFTNAIERVGVDSDRSLIERIYAKRGDFTGDQPEGIRASLYSRFAREKRVALNETA